MPPIEEHLVDVWDAFIWLAQSASDGFGAKPIEPANVWACLNLMPHLLHSFEVSHLLFLFRKLDEVRLRAIKDQSEENVKSTEQSNDASDIRDSR